MQRLRALALAATALALPRSGAAAPAVGVETHVVLNVEAVTLEDGKTKSAGAGRQVEVGPAAPGIFDLTVPWRPKGATVRVHLEARLTSISPD